MTNRSRQGTRAESYVVDLGSGWYPLEVKWGTCFWGFQLGWGARADEAGLLLVCRFGFLCDARYLLLSASKVVGQTCLPRSRVSEHSYLSARVACSASRCKGHMQIHAVSICRLNAEQTERLERRGRLVYYDAELGDATVGEKCRGADVLL